jgi:hypothetical protein
MRTTTKRTTNRAAVPPRLRTGHRATRPEPEEIGFTLEEIRRARTLV